MTYLAVETGLLALVAAVTGMSTAQTAAGDDTLLNKGYDRAAVSRYVGFDQRDFAGGGAKMLTWEIDVHLFTKKQFEGTAHTQAATDRQNIIEKLNANPTGDGICHSLSVVSGRAEPEDIVVGSVKYVEETIRVTLQEQVDFASEE